MSVPEPLTDEELNELDALAHTATPGPWFVRLLDDEHAMNLTAVSTTPDIGRGERWPNFEPNEIVAATLVQQPRYVDIADTRWDENAKFIADARQSVPRLIAEVRRLRQELETIRRTAS